MTRAEAVKFANEWAAAWNARDLERVLEMFSDDIVFVSLTAHLVVGDGTVRGKSGLRAYWTKAMSAINTLRFTVDRVLWDQASRELAIIYVADINGRQKRASENLTFGDDGRVATAEVFHGLAT
jgi:ketosteroid isomerase-like protein